MILPRVAFTLALLGLLAAPLATHAQHLTKVHRIALVFTTSPVSEMAGSDPRHPLARAFVRQLRELGYVEGANLVIERRSAEGKFDRVPALFAELVRLNVEVIVTPTNAFGRAAKEATKTIPIVLVSDGDPVAAGLVDSLARPGGNLTGLDIQAGPELEGKRLELLKEAIPSISRVAYLGQSPPKGIPVFRTETEAAARMLRVTLLPMLVNSPDQFADAFAAITRQRADALLVGGTGFNFAHRRVIVDLAAQSRLPAMYFSRQFGENGGLMSYAADLADLFRRVAIYVDKVLKGANPANLPVEQPTRFELIVNLKTAKVLGLTIPPSILIRADQLIE